MTLAVDNVASYDQSLGGYSWTFTPNVSVPQGILVYVITYNTDPGGDVLTGVTYGGVALTKLGNTLHWDATVDGYGQAWWLPLNTLSGAQTVAVSKSATPSSNSVSVMVVSYTTADATTPIAVDAYNDNLGGTGTTTSASITTSQDAHITAMAIEGALTSPTQTAPVSPLVDVLEDDWGIRMSNYGQISGISSAGTYSTDWTYTSSAAWVIMNVAVCEGEPAGGYGYWGMLVQGP